MGSWWAYTTHHSNNLLEKKLLISHKQEVEHLCSYVVHCCKFLLMKYISQNHLMTSIIQAWQLHRMIKICLHSLRQLHLHELVKMSVWWWYCGLPVIWPTCCRDHTEDCTRYYGFCITRSIDLAVHNHMHNFLAFE